MKRIAWVGLAGLLALTTTACEEAKDHTPPADVMEAIEQDDRLSSLEDALKGTGLDAELRMPGPYTVFAPTDEAFALLPDGLVASLSSAQLGDVLLYHVVADDLKASDVVSRSTAVTEEGGALSIQVIDGGVVLDGRVQVVETDIETPNGTVHIVDAVLVPGVYPGSIVDALAASPRFSTLVNAVATANLAGTLGQTDPLTVLAPTNDAFDRLPEGLVADLTLMQLVDVLGYHVITDDVEASEIVGLESTDTFGGEEIGIQLDGSTVVLDGRVQVTFTDIRASNGVIHVLDSVLVPGEYPGTIVDVLAASPRFDTLVGAVAQEDLAGVLSGENGGAGYTVFAPTNAAFDRLPDDLVETLAGSGALETVLLYHVLGSTVDSAAAIAADGMAVETAASDSSGSFSVSVDLDEGGDLFLDGRTQVTTVDIVANNGIIHVIDSVLVPGVDFPGTLVEALSSYPRFDSLVNAVVAEGLAGSVTDVTVFAPTNDAFASVDLGGRTLSSVLAYHLLGTPKFSGDLGASETTLESSALSIDASVGVVINGSANVIFADIAASDGVVHVIDEVLLQPLP